MSKMNEKGFLLIEMIVCLALTTMMIGVCLPIISQLKLEQKVIADRTDMHHYLYNQIQMIDNKDLPISDTTQVDTVILRVSFYYEDDLIVGQGVWENAKKQTEQAFVYFKSQSQS